MKHSVFLMCILAALLIGGCKSASVNPSTGQSVGFTFHNFKPNRTGEIYALWVEIPKSGISQPDQPLHGLVISKLVSTFTVVDTGIVGFDTSGFSKRLGVDFSLMIRAEVSVERKDSIGDEPAADILVGNITGTYTSGTATLTGEDPLAFGTSLSSVAGVATMGSFKFTPTNYIGEFYLMNVAPDLTKTAGLTNLAVLPSGWQYGVWSVDSASYPPRRTFLGFVVSPNSKDSKSLHDSFDFPGGLSLDSTGLAPMNLINGLSSVLLSLEPITSPRDPLTPFPAPVLYADIPSGQAAFATFPLRNILMTFPSVNMTISR